MFETVHRDLMTYAAFEFPEASLMHRRSRLLNLWGMIRVLWQSQCALAVVLFRFKVWGKRHHLPLLPALADRLNHALFHVYLGDYVEAEGGLYINHGHVVVDGFVHIGGGTTISPFVTIGLSNSVRNWGSLPQGPTIGRNVHIGTGAKILGPVTIGDGARIGANAVVIADVPAGCTAVGMPARVLAPLHERYPPPGDIQKPLSPVP
jgi:serine O-acetyltransferase